MVNVRASSANWVAELACISAIITDDSSDPMAYMFLGNDVLMTACRRPRVGKAELRALQEDGANAVVTNEARGTIHFLSPIRNPPQLRPALGTQQVRFGSKCGKRPASWLNLLEAMTQDLSQALLLLPCNSFSC